jgi:hypothetical protein
MVIFENSDLRFSLLIQSGFGKRAQRRSKSGDKKGIKFGLEVPGTPL